MIQRINTEIEALPILWKWESKTCSGLGFASGNVWSRQARRRRQLESDGSAKNEGNLVDKNQAALGFTIKARLASPESTDVIVRWAKGVDSVLFESFFGMLKRKMEKR